MNCYTLGSSHMTHPATYHLVLFVVQPQRVVSHAQHGDDKVEQSQDAVKPQEVVPERHETRQCHYSVLTPEGNHVRRTRHFYLTYLYFPKSVLCFF